ncbi:TIGR03089 family protein [Gordonia shandongensis]|uniref:TIGR03089 family protein n=1 Tax=Gordonia shandongensis TaxID=376351 RepID=UPI0003F58FEB|nr:TIGR03089 family protein [Gordonia shandongensis]
MSVPTTVTDAVFERLGDHARPMLTYYNESTGERTELSGATLGNWAAKIGNFLRDEAGLAPGDRVRVDLPEHWQTAAVLLGAWWAGAAVDLSDDRDGDHTVAFVSRETLDRHDADEVVVVPLDAFALSAGELPVGVTDFGDAIRAHGDRFVPGAPDGLHGGDAVDSRSVAQVLAAVDPDLSSADRVLTTLPWDTADGVCAHFVGPLLAGASLVFVAGEVDGDRLAAIAETEKVTAQRR